MTWLGAVGVLIVSLAGLAAVRSASMSAAEVSALNAASQPLPMSRATLLFAIVASLCLAVVLVYGWLVTRQLNRRLQRVAEHVSALQREGVARVRLGVGALARGEPVTLRQERFARLDDHEDDELGQMANAVDRMAGECEESLRHCLIAQDAVSRTVGEIGRLASEAREGHLSGKAERGDLAGRYAEMIDGVEAVITAVAWPLSESCRVLTDVAGRNLEVRMRGDFRGEFAQVQTAVNSAIDQLAATVGRVRAASVLMDQAARKMSDNSQQLADGAASQSESAEQVSTAIAALSRTANQAAAQASEMKSSAEEARDSVQRGTATMEALNLDMQRIKQSADATQRIVKTIDEIAFQTNLLALNAAVEAARAGDAGRGFAVVADEVRALAIRSAEAAKQTAALIDEEISNVNGGVAREQQVREQLLAARQHVEAMTGAIVQIVEGARQQSQATTEISHGVSLMSEVTERVAESADQGTGTAEELLEQAKGLAETVVGFKTRDVSSRLPDELSLNARRRSAA